MLNDGKDMQSAPSASPAAPAPAALTNEQREAVIEVMALARDEGLPGTAETLQSILAASPAAPQPSAKALTDAKDWLLDVMGDWDFTIPAGAFDKIVARIVTEQPSEDKHAASGVEADAKDAARYRKVKSDSMNTSEVGFCLTYCDGNNFSAVTDPDAEIDAQIQADETRAAMPNQAQKGGERG